MNKEQVEDTMKLSISKLRELAQTEEGFISVLGAAINFGKMVGIRQTTENLNKAMRGYTPELIRN